MGKKVESGTQEAVAAQQLELGKEQAQLQRENYARMIDLTQPYIDFNKLFLGTGPEAREKAARVMAPQLGEISRGAAAAKESIFDTIAPGPARDYALADLERSRYGSVATTLGLPAMTARENLAQAGSGFGQFSLSQLGAAYSGLGSAANTWQQINDIRQRQQAALLGMIGGLVRTGASVATGGFAGAGGGGGGGVESIPLSFGSNPTIKNMDVFRPF